MSLGSCACRLRTRDPQLETLFRVAGTVSHTTSQSLPDDSTLEEIQYHLYVRQKVLRGLQDVEEGRVRTQEEMEREVNHEH